MAGRLASAFAKYLKVVFLFALVNLKTYSVSCSVLLGGRFFPGVCDGSDSAQALCAMAGPGFAPVLNFSQSSWLVFCVGSGIVGIL